MRRLLREQTGAASATELVLGAGMTVGVLLASLSLYDGFTRSGANAASRNADQEVARAAVTRIARDLRNLASPVPEQPQAIDVAEPADLVVKAVDPDATATSTGENATATRRVRWCVAADGVLHEQTQRWTTALPPAAPARSSCPSTDWGSAQVLAEHLVNDAGSPVFTYDSATPAAIAEIHVDLRVDRDPAAAPAAASVATGVFLRNQNRAPTAAFSATPTASGIVLNGSASMDPEGRPLQYAWYDGATLVGSGVTYTMAAAPRSSHSVSLRVTDPAGLTATAPAQVVTAP